MRELLSDPFYEEISAYNRCILDFCLMAGDVPHQGYQSHKDAVRFAMCRVNERDSEDADEEAIPWSIDMEKAEAEAIDPVSLLHAPEDSARRRDPGGRISYRYAFLETPHRTGYEIADFDKINRLLFPNGAEPLEVYEWSTDWSDYFDDGHEWWGAACWSVYDRSLDRYAVILASTTD